MTGRVRDTDGPRTEAGRRLLRMLEDFYAHPTMDIREVVRLNIGTIEAEAALLARPQPDETEPPSIADGPSVSDQSLAELERLARAATPGPWHKGMGTVTVPGWRDPSGYPHRTIIHTGITYAADGLDRGAEDAAFIAAASPDVVLRLLARRAPGDRGLRELLEEGLADGGGGGSLNLDHRWWREKARRALAADSRPEQPR